MPATADAGSRLNFNCSERLAAFLKRQHMFRSPTATMKRSQLHAELCNGCSQHSHDGRTRPGIGHSLSHQTLYGSGRLVGSHCRARWTQGIAILLVLLRHSIFGVETHSRIGSAFLAAGQLSWSGVDLFFVLSGFLIGGILLDVRESPRYFQTFYVRRAYRILPIYMLTMALFALRHLPFHLPAGLGDVSPVPIPPASRTSP